jgi:hypothetical protein
MRHLMSTFRRLSRRGDPSTSSVRLAHFRFSGDDFSEIRAMKRCFYCSNVFLGVLRFVSRLRPAPTCCAPAARQLGAPPASDARRNDGAQRFFFVCPALPAHKQLVQLASDNLWWSNARTRTLRGHIHLYGTAAASTHHRNNEAISFTYHLLHTGRETSSRRYRRWHSDRECFLKS